MSNTYADLFEDEVAEILTEAGDSAYIFVNNGATAYKKTFCVNYDGIVVHEDMYIRYDYGRRSAIVTTSFIIAHLAHKTFKVKE